MRGFLIANNNIRHMRGWYPDRPDHRDMTLFHPAFSLPPSADLSPKCNSVPDQADIGSCTANAATSAMEYLYGVIGHPTIELSRLCLYYFTRVFVEGKPGEEDSGASIRDTMKALAKYGTAPEDVWPYMPSLFSVCPNQDAMAAAIHHKIIRYYRLPNLDHVKQSIADGFPVVGGFSVPQNMASAECAKTGIIKYPTPDESIIGGHAVMFTGFNDSTKLVKLQNSWGKSWGQDGYGFLPYEFFDKGLATDFSTIRSELV